MQGKLRDAPAVRTGASAGLAGRLAVAALAAAVVAIPFTLLLLLLESRSETLEGLDVGAAEGLQAVARRSDTLVEVLEVIALVTYPWVFHVIVAVVAAGLWWRGSRRLAAWAVVTMAIGAAVGYVAKRVVERARPALDDPVASAHGFSFPSGHAVNSMLGAGVLLLVALSLVRGRRRVLAWITAVTVVVITGLDRILLGVHYVSDVVAGWSVALAVIAATATAFEVWRRGEGRRPSSPLTGVEPEAREEPR